MAAPTGDVPGSDEESPGTSQDKRTAPRDAETDQPRKRLRIDSEGTHGQQEVQSSLLPDDDQLYYIMENTGSKWKNLARKLSFKESDIEGFQEERELQERCMKMLTAWQQKMGDSGTVGALKEALVTVGLKNIADNFDLYRGPESSPKMMNYSDNQLIAEQEKQVLDKTEIQIGNISQSGMPVNWQAIAMAALQGRDVSLSASTGVCNLPWPTTTTSTSPSLDFSFLTWGMLKFHSKVHGKQISIASNGIVAQSYDSFNDGICFSSEPIKVGKKTNLKIIASRTFNESMRFGFTCRNPDSMTVEELPPHSYPTLAQQPGFWVKPFPASLAHHGCVVSFTLKSSGDVTFAVDGEDKGLFFSGVDVSQPLWAVVDIHGSTVALQFVGLEAASEAFDKRIHEGDQVQMWVEDMDALRDMQDGHGGFMSDMEKAVGQVGIAVKIDNDEDVHVVFPFSIYRCWCMSPAALHKVDRPDIRSAAIIEGDLVKITADLDNLMSVQKEKGFWEDGMERAPGKIGRAVGVGQKGEVGVKVEGEKTDMMIFDPQFVQKTENQRDMCAQGLHHWKSGFSKVCVKCFECTAEGDECSMKGKPFRPPGSCCGCARDDAGCADCGLCKSCAGIKSDEEDDSGEELEDQLKSLLRPLESTLKDLVGLSAGLNLENDEPNEYGLKTGDEVEVKVDKDTFKSLQQENSSMPWNDDMAKVIGVPGTILARLLRNDVAVQFQNETMHIVFSGCLTKTRESSETQDKREPLQEGAFVRLVKDEKKLKMLQIGHGGYNDRMQSCLGKTGCVRKVRKQQVQVKFAFRSEEWWYNPKALAKVSSEEQQLQETVHQLNRGDCVKVAVDPETFSANQLGHGGSVDPVSRALETAGVIRHFDNDGDAFVCFQNGLRRLINPTSLEKVNPEDHQENDSSDLKEGEWIKVDADKAKMKQVQKEVVPWNDGYYAAAGKIGFVQNILPFGKIRVHITSASAGFPLHASLVKRASLADMQEHFGRSFSSEFARGDLVRINVSLEELRCLQEGHGGYKPHMEKVMTEAGSVSFIDHEGDIHVRFGLKRLCFNPSALTKIITTEDKLYVGDLVQIESDLERFKTLQTPKEHGKYVEPMATACGKTGRLLAFVDSNMIRVKVQGRAWLFNPDLLTRIGSPRTATTDWKSATICAGGNHNWSVGRCMVCVVCGECTDEGKLCHTRGKTGRIPGSVTGCGDGHAGCDDCGACKSCAGVEGEELTSVKVQEVIKKTLKEEANKKFPLDEAKTVIVKHRLSESEGEVEVGRNKMLALLDRMTQVIELIRASKYLDSNEKVMRALVQHIHIPLRSNPSLRKQLGDHLSNIGAAAALMEYGGFLSSQASQCDGTKTEQLYGCLRILYGVFNDCAYISSDFSHTLCRSGLMQMTVQELAHRYDMEKSDVNQVWIQLLVTTLGNFARVADNKDYLRDTGAVELLKKHLSNEDMVLKVVTLSCLAHIVDAEELDTIKFQTEDKDLFMNTLKTAVGDAERPTAFGGAKMSPKDFVIDLLALSCHDGNKHAFVEKGVMGTLIHLIENGNDKEKECSMLCVQRFAEVDSIRETIVSEARVEEVLRELLTQSTPYAVQVAARKTLKCLGKEHASS